MHSTHFASTTIPERLHRVVHVFREDLVQLRTHLVHLGGFLVVQPGIVKHQPHVIAELSMVQRHRKEYDTQTQEVRYSDTGRKYDTVDKSRSVLNITQYTMHTYTYAHQLTTQYSFPVTHIFYLPPTTCRYTHPLPPTTCRYTHPLPPTTCRYTHPLPPTTCR